MRPFRAAAPVVVAVCLPGAFACTPQDESSPAACDVGAVVEDGCVLPWREDCAAVGDACVPGAALRCSSDAAAPPEARCEECGCAGADACIDGPDDDAVCVSAEVREGVRDLPRIDEGLSDDAYVALFASFDARGQDVVTLDAAVAHLVRRAAADPRRRVVAVGRIADERSARVLAALDAQPLARSQTCAERAAAMRATSFGPGPLLVEDGAEDDADDVTCLFPGSFPRCAPPSRAACFARGGALPASVVVLDELHLLERLDDVLVRSVARTGRTQWSARLDAVIALFQDLVLSRARQPAFDVDGVEVRVFVDERDGGDLVSVWMPAFDARPRRGLAFRTLWDDAPTQDFLSEHDIVPGECSFVVDGDDVVVDCVADDSAAVHAVVDTRALVIVTLETTP